MSTHIRPVMSLMVIAALAAGCGWFAEEATEKAMEFSAGQDGEEVDVEFDSESGQMTIKSDKGDVSINMENDSGRFEMTNEEGTFTLATGEDADLPDDFPKDVPLYPGLKPNMVQTLPNGGFSIAGSVRVAIPDVSAFYEKQASKEGWTETGTISQQHVASLTYEKDGRMLQVTATPDANGTMIALTTMKQQ